jgi:arylsulfatase A-like enzyme
MVPRIEHPHVARLLIGLMGLLFLGACSESAPTDSSGDSSRTASEMSGGAAARGDGDAAPSAASNAVDGRRPKRIILISLDTVGARHVGGYGDAKTPTLEKIAADGARYDRFYAASTYTLPSHMSMMTGLDPIEHGVVNLPSRLAPRVPTLASELRKAGYHTKAVTEGGFIGSIYGFDQGFDEVIERVADEIPKTTIWGVLDWMRTKEKTPYFLFIHTYVAHVPYGGFRNFRDRHPELDLPDEPEIIDLKKRFPVASINEPVPAPRDIPAELRFMCTFYNNVADTHRDVIGCGDRQFKSDFLESEHFDAYREGLVDAHREAIRRGDRMVGQIRDVLIELGQLDDTLLVVTSDHGDAIFEHGVHEHDYLPFDEVVKVPLVLSYPRRVEGGQVIRGLGWHLDLFPTILSLAGIRVDGDLHGMDLSGGLLGDESISDDRAIHPILLRPANRSPMPRRRMTLRGDYKFIEGHRIYGDPEGLLYDVQNSPGEDENLRESMPEVFAELRELALDFEGGLTPGEPIHRETKRPISPFPGDVEPFELSEEVRRGLAELGYLVGEEPVEGAQ